MGEDASRPPSVGLKISKSNAKFMSRTYQEDMERGPHQEGQDGGISGRNPGDQILNMMSRPDMRTIRKSAEAYKAVISSLTQLSVR